MSAWSDDDAELLLRAGDGVSTVARLLGMDIERVENIAAERPREKLSLDERQRIGEIRAELRGEPPPKPPPRPKLPHGRSDVSGNVTPAVTKPTPPPKPRAAPMPTEGECREQAACGAMFDAGAEWAWERHKVEMLGRDAAEAHRREDLAVDKLRATGIERDEALKRAAIDRAEINDAINGCEEYHTLFLTAERERDEAREELSKTKTELASERRDGRMRILQITEAQAEIEKLRETLKDAGEIYNREASALAMREQAKTDVFRVTAERDEARAEADQLRASLADVSNLRAAEQRAALDAAEAKLRAEARAEAAEAEVRRLAGEVRGLAELATAVRRMAAPREKPYELQKFAPSVSINGPARRIDREQLKAAISSAEDRVRKAGAACAHDKCSRPIHVRGLCREHYIPRWAAGEAPPSRPAVCIADGCGKHVKAKNLCSRHYEQQRKPS